MLGMQQAVQQTEVTLPAPPENAFTELLERVKQADIRYVSPENPFGDPLEATEQARNILGELIDPEAQKRERYEEGMAEYWDTYEPFQSTLRKADQELVKEMQERLKNYRPKKKKLAGLFRDKNFLVQSMIMHEALKKPKGL